MATIDDGLAKLLDVLPPVVRDRLRSDERLPSLVEVVLDYGRNAEVRFLDDVDRWTDMPIDDHQIEYVVKSIGEFGEDNRAGIERTLHRISAIRNRHGRVVGLTCRIGRALEGTIDIIDDIVRSGQSILMLGKPGVGKTTKLREVARVLADEAQKRVVIVDTSNEIGGDGDIPHPAIGSARRMQVPRPELQHNVMIEAVENHMPEVIVIDEIGNEAEAQAARTIGERGVQLIGTAHGGSLENLMLNPALCDLIGGIQAVTLSDDEAKRRGTQKTVLERKAPPTFDVVIELMDYDRLAVHHNVMKTVDLMLRGVLPRPEVRVKQVDGVEIVQREESPELHEPGFNERFPSLARSQDAAEPDAKKPKREPKRLLRIFPYGIARTRLERAIQERSAVATIVTDIKDADAIIAIRSTYNSKPAKIRELNREVPTVVIKSNTSSQIAGALDELLKGKGIDTDEQSDALEEAKSAAESVANNGRSRDLKPQRRQIRQMQHEIAQGSQVFSESVGQEPHRFVRFRERRSA